MKLLLMPTMLFVFAVVACDQQSVESESQADSNSKAMDVELKLVSERWKTERRTSDFHILRAELPTGVSSKRVVELLGEPVGHTQDEGKEYFEYIQGFKDNTTGWGAVIGSDDKLIEWYQDSPQSMTTGAEANGGPLEIALAPNEEESRDYGNQLIEKFNTVLESNEELQAQFATYEAAPKERSSGRYLGFVARPLLLHQSVDVDFQDSGGRRDYIQTLALYYSFREGYHRGMEETSGVFAVFHLVGHQSYNHKEGDDFELVKHTVSAKFLGFQKSIKAEQDSVE